MKNQLKKVHNDKIKKQNKNLDKSTNQQKKQF